MPSPHFLGYFQLIICDGKLPPGLDSCTSLGIYPGEHPLPQRGVTACSVSCNWLVSSSLLVESATLLELETLRQQATNDSKEQFANSPDLKTELLNVIMGALDAHNLMSTQALNSSTVQGGLKDILLNHAGLYETLRGQAGA